MGAFARASLLRHVFESIRYQRCGWQRGWWAPMDLRSTQASRRRRQQAALGSQARTGSLKSRRTRFAPAQLSRHTRRRGVRVAASPVTRSSFPDLIEQSAVDRRAQGACFLRLLRQLSDRHRPRRDRRCRSHASHSTGGGWRSGLRCSSGRSFVWREARTL